MSEQTGPEPMRIAGIPVQVTPSGLLGIAVLAYLWAPTFAGASGAPGWVVAAAFAVLLSLATLVHEMAHALVARRVGFPVRGVVLQLLGGVTHYERTRTSPLAEAAIAASGPVATFAVAALSWLLLRVLDPSGVAAALAGAMLWANLVIGVYNSLPGLPLDGGAVLRSLVWSATGSERRGTVVAAWAGRLLALLTLLSPAFLGPLLGVEATLLAFVVAGLLAGMLYSGATAALRGVELRERAGGLTAGGLARRAIPVDRDTPLAEGIRRANVAGAGALVVVDPNGVPLAIGQHDAIAAVPEQRRPWITVGAVSRGLDATATVPAELAGHDLIAEVARSGRAELLVLDDAGLLYGVLLVADLDAALRRSG